jgi:hypothetical protein
MKLKNESVFNKSAIPASPAEERERSLDGGIRPTTKKFSLSNESKYESNIQKKVFYKPGIISNAFAQNN